MSGTWRVGNGSGEGSKQNRRMYSRQMYVCVLTFKAYTRFQYNAVQVALKVESSDFLRWRFEAWLASLPAWKPSKFPSFSLSCKMGLWQSPLYRVNVGNWCVQHLVQDSAYIKCSTPTSYWTLLLSASAVTEGQRANQSPATHTSEQFLLPH